jgi:ubiquitin carboxyl-terminal hydrolase 34
MYKYVVVISNSRQCTCCYREVKNFERLNNIVQVILNFGIKFIKTWPADYEKELAREKKDGAPEENETKGDEETGKEQKVDDDKKSQGKDVIQCKKPSLLQSMNFVYMFFLSVQNA